MYIMHFVCVIPFTAEMRELERIFVGTTSSDTEEIPCDENVTSEDKSSVSDSTKETIISPDENKVILSDKSEETIIPPKDKIILKNELEETDIQISSE